MAQLNKQDKIKSKIIFENTKWQKELHVALEGVGCQVRQEPSRKVELYRFLDFILPTLSRGGWQGRRFNERENQ